MTPAEENEPTPAMLTAWLAAAQAELTRVSNQNSRMLMDQVRHDREVYAAAQRAAQEDRRSWSDLYFGKLVRDSGQPFRALAYRVMQLSDRPGAQVLEDLRSVARQADARLDYGYQVVEQDPGYGDRVNAEVVRLRAYIHKAGQGLHARYGVDAEGRSGPGPCRCPGCELIRGMDVVEEGQQQP